MGFFCSSGWAHWGSPGPQGKLMSGNTGPLVWPNSVWLKTEILLRLRGGEWVKEEERKAEKKERHDLESTKGIRREKKRGLFVSQWDVRTKITLEGRSIIQNDWPQVSSINHLNWMWMQKTNEIHRQGQSAFQTAVSLCICRRTEHQQSGRRRVMAGPSGSQNSATPQSRQHQRSVGSEEKKNERRGPRGSDSHIPQSPVYQGHTCPPPLPLPSASVHQSLTLPKCQGRDLGDSANSTPRLVGRGHKQRAEKGEKGRELERQKGREWGLNGTVWKTHLNWRLFCDVLFFLGICEGEGQEGGEVWLFPKVLNSRINHRGETQ